jgi:hypothetical protein
VRVGASVGSVRINENQTAQIASAIKLACQQLKEDEFKGSRRAIILLFGTPDPGLPRQMQIVRSVLAATKARLYVVAVDRSIEQNRIPGGSSLPYPPGLSPRGQRLPVPQTTPFPIATAQMLEQLAKDSGGHMYRRNWDLTEILEAARKQ